MLTHCMPKTARTLVASIILGAVTASAAMAETIFSATADPFPNGSALDLAGATVPNYGAVSTHYFENITIESDSFNLITNVETITLAATDYVEFANGGSPLSYTAPATLTVAIDGRTASNQTGTFVEILSSADSTGTLSNGSVASVDLNPDSASTGSVTIAATAGGYDITNDLTINGEASVDGGPEVVATPATATSLPIGFSSSTAVPEPASLALFGASLAGIALVRRRGGAARPSRLLEPSRLTEA